MNKVWKNFNKAFYKTVDSQIFFFISCSFCSGGAVPITSTANQRKKNRQSGAVQLCHKGYLFWYVQLVLCWLAIAQLITSFARMDRFASQTRVATFVCKKVAQLMIAILALLLITGTDQHNCWPVNRPASRPSLAGPASQLQCLQTLKYWVFVWFS